MDQILVGKGEQPVYLLAKYGNRHGLVAGATGTGKTVSLMVVAEGFSRLGVPVFMADVKGDVAGLAMAGAGGDKIQQRVTQLGIDRLRARGQPRRLLGSLRQGRPSRARHRSARSGRACSAASSSSTTRRPACSRSPSSWPTTAGCCCSTSTICARCSASSPTTARRSRRSYGLVSARVAGAPSSARLLTLEREGGEALFGEPALELDDLMRTDLERPRDHQHPGRRPAHPEAAALLELPAVAAVGAVREPAGGRRSRQARSSSSSSTRRTCCSTTRRRRCASASSRSCGSSARRAWACTSARSSPTTCRTRSSASSATASSTRCAPTRRATRRRCARRPRPSRPTPSSTSRR